MQPVEAAADSPGDSLEENYRQGLGCEFGDVFTALIYITRMPIKRFADELARLRHAARLHEPSSVEPQPQSSWIRSRAVTKCTFWLTVVSTTE